MNFEPSPAQRNAIFGKGTLLVSAAAGSGKTAVLVQRVIEKILDEADPVDADRMLVVTFTNAAAAEMKQRISAELSKVIKNNPGNTRLIRQKILLSSAPICTMDSFCLDLVRSNFHSLNVSPDFKIADSSSLQPLEKKAISEVTDEAFLEGSPDFLLLLELLGADFAEDNIRNAIEKIYSYQRSLPFPDEWADMVVKMYEDASKGGKNIWVQRVLRYASDLLNNCRSRLTACEPLAFSGGNEKIIEAHTLAVSEITRLLSATENYDSFYKALLSFVLEKPRRTAKIKELPGCDEIYGALDGLNACVTKLKKIISSPLDQCTRDIAKITPAIKYLFFLTKKYWQKLDDLKAEKRLLDFSDIEYKALELLVKKEMGEVQLTKAAKALSERFAEVLVDEYQDTNDLQNTIVNALSAGGEKLFMVGDVKQSIYRFRKANPENFLRSYHSFKDYDGEEGASRILLSANYRSRKGVCDYVNLMFSLLMSKQAGDMDYAENERLIPEADYPDRDEADTELHILDTANCDENYLVYEARHIGDYIKGLCENPLAVRDKDSETGYRKAKFSDFAILLRSHGKRQGIFASELIKKGIPVWVTPEGNFLNTVEISTVMALLQTIDNPVREIPLAAVMNSAIFKFTPDELAKIRAANKKTNFYSAVIKYAASGDEKTADFLKKLSHYRRLSATLPSDRLIQKLYDLTGYYNLVQSMDGGAQRRANLILLLEYARNFESGGFRGLTGFLRYISRLDPKGSGLSPAATSSEDDDVVKIMSVHRSKGLQFPICILAACSANFNQSDTNSSMILHEKYGIGLKVFDEAKRTKYSTLPRDVAAIEVNRAAISEELRVLYVALTRAQERLLMTVSLKDTEKTLKAVSSDLRSGFDENTAKLDAQSVLKAKGFFQLILMASMLHPGGKILREMSGGDVNPTVASEAHMVKIINASEVAEGDMGKSNDETALPDPQILKEIDKRVKYQYPFEVLKGVAAKRAASRLTAEESDSDFWFSSRPAFLSGAKASPAQRGISIHEFMQFADYEAAAHSVPEEIARLVNGGFISRAQGDLIDIGKVASFFESELYKRICASEKIYREHRFLVSVPLKLLETEVPSNAAEEEIVIQGSADCVFEENGELVIVDYKTDRTSKAEDLIYHYAPQLRLYAIAIGKNLGKPVKELLLYSFSQKRTINIPPAPKGAPVLDRSDIKSPEKV